MIPQPMMQAPAYGAMGMRYPTPNPAANAGGMWMGYPYPMNPYAASGMPMMTPFAAQLPQGSQLQGSQQQATASGVSQKQVVAVKVTAPEQPTAIAVTTLDKPVPKHCTQAELMAALPSANKSVRTTHAECA